MMSKENIKDMFGQIQTPEYNPADDITDKINQGYKIKPGISRFKRTLIIVASVISVVILMGAALDFYVVRVFNEDGSSYLEFRPFRHRTPPEGEELERLQWENEFFYGGNSGNILGLTFYGDGATGRANIQKAIYDYGEFLELMNHADSEIFKLPQYIPEGYEFFNAWVIFYIDENFDCENTEPIERVEKYGNIYEKYYVPENPENIENMSVSFVNGEIGNSINYSIWLHEFQANRRISGAENSQLEILQMPQFYRSSIMSTDYTENGKSWTMYSFSGINTCPVKRYLTAGAFSKEYREKRRNYSFTGELGSVEYGIGSYYGIGEDFAPSRDEIIKMAESIK